MLLDHLGGLVQLVLGFQGGFVPIEALLGTSCNGIVSMHRAHDVAIRKMEHARACNAPLNNNGECDTETCLTDSQAIRKWVESTNKHDFTSTGSAEEEFWNLVDEE